MDKMRAGRMVDVGRMVCEETEVWEPADGDLIVRSSYASICGSDLHIVCHGVDVPPMPCNHGFPGHEGIGEVVESRHLDFAPGDMVLTVPNAYVGTCFNEYQTLGASYCLKLPDTDRPQLEMLMAQQLGTVIWALRKNPVDVTGKTVVVLGQGSAGLFFTHLLKRAGAAKVITAELTAARMKLSTQLGADLVVANHGDALQQAVMDETGGMGADHVVEAVGRRQTLLQSVDLARPDGTMLWFGLPDAQDPVPVNFHDFFRKRLTAWSTYGAQDEPDLASFQVAANIIAGGELDVSGIVSHVLPIEDIGPAFDLANDPATDDAIKVSLSFS
ncbi:MAG: zinc-binding dehydrogenase [Actinomycetia bacterium]|nr:zinc-binding dehydrogenase [Actinomycetes bacterium]MCP4223311.1 zinc-binding dehydrogenase [Actinomycetes bacterium]MCP5035618.1 zinc-binding dehydrogenase [Actinomycetes bacterium]